MYPGDWIVQTFFTQFFSLFAINDGIGSVCNFHKTYTKSVVSVSGMEWNNNSNNYNDTKDQKCVEGEKEVY